MLEFYRHIVLAISGRGNNSGQPIPVDRAGEKQSVLIGGAVVVIQMKCDQAIFHRFSEIQAVTGYVAMAGIVADAHI